MAALEKRSIGIVVASAVFFASSCAPRESVQERHQEANTPAGKLGQVAHKAAVEADKAGRVIGRQVDKAVHDAREGWKEDASKTKGQK